jgi:hypothetical protein
MEGYGRLVLVKIVTMEGYQGLALLHCNLEGVCYIEILKVYRRLAMLDCNDEVMCYIVIFEGYKGLALLHCKH